MNEKKLDFSGRTQLYYQLYDILLDDIKSGKYKAGELLPTENELIAKYDVSRITVRKAMDLLLNEGLIGKRRGYGTYVEQKKMEQTLNKVIHFSNDMERRGYKTSVKMLENKQVKASKIISQALEVPEGSSLIHVNRLRYANDIPMCIESAYLIWEWCPEVLNYNFAQLSLRNFLAQNYNIVWKKAFQKIYAVKANIKFANLLGIKDGDPMIYIERISYNQDGAPGEYLQSYYRSDMFYLTAELEA